MARWEFAMFSNPASGDDGVAFSHSQASSIVSEFSDRLGRGMRAERSDPTWLNVNMNHTNMARIAGLLGERGWQMVGFSTLTGGHAYMMFTRQLPDRVRECIECLEPIKPLATKCPHCGADQIEDDDGDDVES
jgi:hypothetical protein